MVVTKQISLLALLLPLGIGVSSSLSAVSRPNIIFIMSDDHAAQAISSYGSVINQTPNLDRLATEGMLFENCFCTNSICAPSRAVILSGRHSHLNGVRTNGDRFDTSQATFPKLLQAGGYQTALIGKWHLKSDPVGFDYWHILPGQGHYYNPELIEMGRKHQVEGYVSDIITDEVLKWLTQKRAADKPFCLLYYHKAPHRNWMPGPNHLTLYNGQDIPVPETFFDDYATRSTAASDQEMTVAHHLQDAYDLKLGDNFTYNRMTPAQKAAWDKAYAPQIAKHQQGHPSDREKAQRNYQRYIKDYLRCIASIDDNLGRLLDYLDKHDLTRDTLVVYTSDQGFFLGEHGWYDKRFMYEESLRMPLLVRYPAMIQPGSRSDALVQNLDFAPTLLELAGLSTPVQMQGRSIVPLLNGKMPNDWREAIYYHYYEYPGEHKVRRHYGIRTQRYKLIHFYHDIDAWELYDLHKDRRELRNLYGYPAYRPVQDELKQQLTQLQKKYQVPTDISIK